ncbi:MAG: hypothetical protein NC820_08265 [Candidatus Omnitrophica bacterium]|nr:hypothetical protein [Candidatus Omnitrophota bacterium]
MERAGSYRALEKLTTIPKGSLCGYLKGRLVTEKRLKILLDFLNIKTLEYRKLPLDWRQIKGGINCVKIKKQKGVFERNLKKMHKASSDRMKGWHREMKKNKPKEYYSLQYSRFKKVWDISFKHLKEIKLGINWRKRLQIYYIL